jgi:hypothetical protein
MRLPERKTPPIETIKNKIYEYLKNTNIPLEEFDNSKETFNEIQSKHVFNASLEVLKFIDEFQRLKESLYFSDNIAIIFNKEGKLRIVDDH